MHGEFAGKLGRRLPHAGDFEHGGASVYISSGSAEGTWFICSDFILILILFFFLTKKFVVAWKSCYKNIENEIRTACHYAIRGSMVLISFSLIVCSILLNVVIANLNLVIKLKQIQKFVFFLCFRHIKIICVNPYSMCPSALHL